MKGLEDIEKIRKEGKIIENERELKIKEIEKEINIEPLKLRNRKVDLKELENKKLIE